MQCSPNITIARWNAPDASQPRLHTGCVANSAVFIGRLIRCRADSSDTRMRNFQTLLPEVLKTAFCKICTWLRCISCCVRGYRAQSCCAGAVWIAGTHSDLTPVPFSLQFVMNYPCNIKMINTYESQQKHYGYENRRLLIMSSRRFFGRMGVSNIGGNYNGIWLHKGIY